METQQTSAAAQVASARALIHSLQAAARATPARSPSDQVAFRYGRAGTSRIMRGMIAGRAPRSTGEIIAIQIEGADGLPEIVRVRPAAILDNAAADRRFAEAEESAQAARELADALVEHAANGSIRPATARERVAEASRTRFDGAHTPPADGPVADAYRRSEARTAAIAERRAACEKVGRFYVEAYHCRKARGRRWRVQDRCMGAVAYFALDGLKTPSRLEGYRTQADAIAPLRWLESYFHRLGCGMGPLPGSLPDAALVGGIPDAVMQRVPDDLWQAVASLIPSEPSGKRSAKPRQIDSRAALAGLVAYLAGDAGWHGIPAEIGCSPMLIRKRFGEWRDAGAWPAISAAIQAHPAAPAGLSWEKVDGAPTITPAERAALIERIERFRERRGMTIGEASKAIFGHGSNYPRILHGGAVLARTARRVAALELEA